MLKKTAIVVAVIIGLAGLLFLSLFAPIDYTPLSELPSVRQTYKQLDTMTYKASEGSSALKAGWARKNITPDSPINMAGYGLRGPYIDVSDSLFARTMVIENGLTHIAIISLDLLMFPPVIMQMLYDTLSAQGFTQNELYFTATHTHNGFGNWEKSMAGRLIFGNYLPDQATLLVNKIVASVLDAQQNTSNAAIAYRKIEAQEWVSNRINEEDGVVDPYLRVIEAKKTNGDRAMLVSFAAHAVNLDADIWQLDRDYPGVLVDELEMDPKVDFAMFCAGMVASHNLKSELPKGHKRIKEAGVQLAKKSWKLKTPWFIATIAPWLTSILKS